MTDRRSIGAVLATTLIALAAACSSETIAFTPDEPASSGQFTQPDASTDAGPDASKVLANLCASNHCPPGRTTCPSSTYPCDIDISDDIENCGGCGNMCPGAYRNALFGCKEAKCEITACGTDPLATYPYADCNGLPDDGCEVLLGDENNCSKCGEKCADGEPCVRTAPFTFQCGCPTGLTYCLGTCVDTTKSDLNCATCENACDDSAPAPPNSYEGCGDSKCGQLKCLPPQPPVEQWADCDGDLFSGAGSNGCESNLYEPNDDHCGACDVKCTGGQHCFMDYGAYIPRCMCPQGSVFCNEQCVDIMNDPNNCGGCQRGCLAALGVNQTQVVGIHSTPVCNNGACSLICETGFVDCNNDMFADGCEIDVRSDPNNCGACGNICNGVAGQPCVGGKCATEPCADQGGVQ